MPAPQRQDSKKENWPFQDFGGVNTQASAQAIKDNEFAWIENLQPIGFGNLKVVPAASASLATVGSGTCYYMLDANIGNVDYMFMFCSDGSLYQVNLTTYARVTVAAAGTFNGSGSQACQWGNSILLIIDPAKGYFSWNGTTLVNLNSTVTSVTATTPGSGYTTRPNVTFTPVSGGSGAAANAIVGCAAAVLSAAGTGYFAGDILTVSGGTFNTQIQIKVTSVNGLGAITAFAIYTYGDYTNTTGIASPATVTGGLGTGATFTLTLGIVSVTMTSGGTGYLLPPTVGFSSGAAAGTAYLSVAPSGGNCIASYSGRVWISAGRTVVFSAPGSYTDFSTANAGGSFIVQDETLHSNINQLTPANNFLYIVGDTSINVISNVSVNSGITIFSNTNVSASVGSTFYASVVPYYRSVWFANRFGMYALYGSTTQKASDNLDGIFPLINFGQTISACQFILYNILCIGFLVSYNDPVQGNRPLLALYSGKKWYFASQASNLTFIAGATQKGIPTVYGTDGANLYQLFSNTTSNVTHTFTSKLWNMGDPLRVKQVLKVGAETNISSLTLPSINISLNTEYGYQQTTQSILPGAGTLWKNNSGQIVGWQNNALQTVTWLGGTGGYAFTKFDASNYGNYIGLTLSATIPQAVYLGFHIQYESRAIWATPGS